MSMRSQYQYDMFQIPFIRRTIKGINTNFLLSKGIWRLWSFRILYWNTLLIVKDNPKEHWEEYWKWKLSNSTPLEWRLIATSLIRSFKTFRKTYMQLMGGQKTLTITRKYFLEKYICEWEVLSVHRLQHQLSEIIKHCVWKINNTAVKKSLLIADFFHSIQSQNTNKRVWASQLYNKWVEPIEPASYESL